MSTLSTPTLHTARYVESGARSQHAPGSSWLAALFATLQAWLQRARGRSELRKALRLQHATSGTALWLDLGVSSNELRDEANKPFWRA